VNNCNNTEGGMQCTTRRLVEHCDVDGYGVVHFARYAAFSETVALALFEKIGLGLRKLQAAGIELRIRHLDLRYRAAAGFSDDLVLHSKIGKIGIAHVEVTVRISRENATDEAVTMVDGKLDFAFVGAETGTVMQVPSEMILR
jgi:YbgC/YbaW family acyl-CoA thioester hydrolase